MRISAPGLSGRLPKSKLAQGRCVNYMVGSSRKRSFNFRQWKYYIVLFVGGLAKKVGQLL